jgi:hypothetical protein
MIKSKLSFYIFGYPSLRVGSGELDPLSKYCKSVGIYIP